MLSNRLLLRITSMFMAGFQVMFFANLFMDSAGHLSFQEDIQRVTVRLAGSFNTDDVTALTLKIPHIISWYNMVVMCWIIIGLLAFLANITPLEKNPSFMSSLYIATYVLGFYSMMVWLDILSSQMPLDVLFGGNMPDRLPLLTFIGVETLFFHGTCLHHTLYCSGYDEDDDDMESQIPVVAA